MSQIQIRSSWRLVIPKVWKYTVFMEAHDKLGHQGATCTYHLIKCQYYWKGMNKDIRKYIANCTLCCREKPRFCLTLCKHYNHLLVVAPGTLGMMPATSLGLVRQGWKKGISKMPWGFIKQNREEPLIDII